MGIRDQKQAEIRRGEILQWAKQLENKQRVKNTRKFLYEGKF